MRKISNTNQFIPYLILEKYFKIKYLEDIKAFDDFLNYISFYFGVEKKKIEFYIDVDDHDITFNIPQKDNNFYKIIFKENGTIKNNLCVSDYNDPSCSTWHIVKKDITSSIFETTPETKKFFQYYLNEYKLKLDKGYQRIQTSNSDIFLDIKTYLNRILITLYDKHNEKLYSKRIEANEEIQTFGNNNKGKRKHNEEAIVKFLISLKVDISSFDLKERERINQFYLSSIGNLEKEREEKIKEFRKIQIDRVMLAYQKLKEVAELLNDTKMDLKFDKIKIDNLREIIFKNSGNPTEKGYIEFEDYFRNNMILRMLDLSNLDLTNVNITYMDFSGTNVHINPQTIHNKDMSGVNAFDVSFSPFYDNFDDVILDGTMINDWEAMINFDRLRSHSDTTIIKEEVLFKFK